MEGLLQQRDQSDLMAAKKTTKAAPASEEREFPLPIERPSAMQRVNIILYGDSGAGKTSLAGSAQECEATSPVLFIDVDSGTSTLQGKEIDVVRPRTWHDIQKIYEHLRDENVYYKAVIIDSLSEMQKKFSMGTILGEIKEGGDSYNDLGSTPVPTRQDWMKTGDQMRKLIRAFRDLAYLEDEDRRLHVIMIALEKSDEKRKVICPQLPGTLGNECGAFVDILARLSKQNIEEEDEATGETTTVTHRILLTEDYINELDIRHMAKDRSGKIGTLWDPTMADIIEAFQS
jgi:hypothetical protein